MPTNANGVQTPNLTDAPNVPGDLATAVAGILAAYGQTVADETALLALVAPFAGQRVYVTSLGQTATYNGSTWEGYWKSYTPTLGWTNTTATTARYMKNGKTVTVEFLLTLTGTPVGTFTIALPSTATASAVESVGTAMLRDNSVGDGSRRSGTIFLPSTTTASVLVDSLTSAAIISPTVPWTQATSDTVGGMLTYVEA